MRTPQDWDMVWPWLLGSLTGCTIACLLIFLYLAIERSAQ